MSRLKIQNVLSCIQLEYSETFFRIQSNSETMTADGTGWTGTLEHASNLGCRSLEHGGRHKHTAATA
jgi:hypothetical protein